MTAALGAALLNSLPILLPALLGLGYHFLQSRSARAAAVVKEGIVLAFHAVEDLVNADALPAGLSKEAAGLAALAKIVKAQGGSVSDDAAELAKLAWKAMNAQLDAQADAAAVQAAQAPVPLKPA